MRGTVRRARAAVRRTNFPPVAKRVTPGAFLRRMRALRRILSFMIPTLLAAYSDVAELVPVSASSSVESPPPTEAALRVANKPAAQTIGAFAGIGYLASPGSNGTVVTGGLRYAWSRHIALGGDVGYGAVGTNGPTVQDRWWLIPSLAFVIPMASARLDLGGGAGLGASSGYVSWTDYVAKPFAPTWAFQLVPVVRAHAMLGMPLTRDVDLFARLEVAQLCFLPTSHATMMDSTWGALSIGAQFRLL